MRGVWAHGGFRCCRRSGRGAVSATLSFCRASCTVLWIAPPVVLTCSGCMSIGTPFEVIAARTSRWWALSSRGTVCGTDAMNAPLPRAFASSERARRQRTGSVTRRQRPTRWRLGVERIGLRHRSRTRSSARLCACGPTRRAGAHASSRSGSRVHAASAE